MPLVVQESQTVLYADDTTIFASSRYPSNIQVDLTRDISRLEKWFCANDLRLNIEKTEYMIIANSHIRKRFEQIKIKVGGKLIIEKEKMKILGVTMSNDLRWDAHANNIINGLKHSYRGFSRACKMLPLDSRRLLYNSAIASRLNYCDAVWDNCSVYNRNRLQTIQNRCARRILNCRPGTHAPPLLKELGWLPLAQKRKLHKCVLLFKLLKGEGPDVLCEKANTMKMPTAVTTRASANNNLKITTHNTNYMGKSFFCDTIKTWNIIPPSIRQTKNVNTFKENLHKFLLRM